VLHVGRRCQTVQSSRRGFHDYTEYATQKQNKITSFVVNCLCIHVTRAHYLHIKINYSTLKIPAMSSVQHFNFVLVNYTLSYRLVIHITIFMPFSG